MFSRTKAVAAVDGAAELDTLRRLRAEARGALANARVAFKVARIDLDEARRVAVEADAAVIRAEDLAAIEGAGL